MGGTLKQVHVEKTLRDIDLTIYKLEWTSSSDDKGREDEAVVALDSMRNETDQF